MSGQQHAPAALYPGKDLPIVQEGGWDPGPVWTGGKSRPHRDFFNYNFIDPSVHKYNGCMEYISVIYCERTIVLLFELHFSFVTLGP